MTREEILALEAGQDLDALIAKEIMGLEVSRLGTRFALVMVEKGVWNKPDPYSTDISAAGQLLLNVEGAWDIKKRYRPHPDDPPGTGGRATYQAIIVITELEDLVETIERKFRSPWCWQLPEAICKAALLAKLEGGESGR